MNLREVLDFRKICPICQGELKLDGVELANLIICDTALGLSVCADADMSITFRPNGTYDKTVKWLDIFSKELEIKKTCVNCYQWRNSTNEPQDYYSYYFVIRTVPGNRTYTCQLLRENINFYHNNKYYQLLNNHYASICHGNICMPGSNYDRQLPMTRLPIVNTTKLTDKNKCVDKITKLLLLS